VGFWIFAKSKISHKIFAKTTKIFNPKHRVRNGPRLPSLVRGSRIFTLMKPIGSYLMCTLLRQQEGRVREGKITGTFSPEKLRERNNFRIFIFKVAKSASNSSTKNIERKHLL